MPTGTEWRNAELQFLRTPYLITEKMQDNFYDDIVQNRCSNHRYFAIMETDMGQTVIHYKEGTKQPRGKLFIGMCGLTNIEWENGTAEISLIINPEYRRQGKGREAVYELLGKAFLDMQLYSVYGEVYDCGNRGFWESIVDEYSSYKTDLKYRKYYDGEMHDSMWFAFQKDDVI